MNDSNSVLYQADDQFGPFRIVSLLGEGGMGAVYRAIEIESNREVALKLPKVDAGSRKRIIGRFKREAGTIASINHPGICQMYDFGDVDGQFYLSMGFVDGPTLSNVIKKKEISTKQIALLSRKLAVAIAAAHDQGVIHRDIKPGNVMLTKKGEPVVMDFGLARMEDVDDTQLTKTGAFLGTPAYASPEQITNRKGEVDQRTDIYSLGVIIYRMLAGQLPYDASNTVNMIAQVLAEDPAPPTSYHSEACPRLSEIAMKAMARDVSSRYQTMYELAADLTSYLKGDTQPRGQMETVATDAEVAAEELDVFNTQEVDQMSLNLIDTGSHDTFPRRRKKKSKRQRKREADQRKMMLFGGGLVGIVVVGFALFQLLDGNDDSDSNPGNTTFNETTNNANSTGNQNETNAPVGSTNNNGGIEPSVDEIPADPGFAALLGQGDWQWSEPKPASGFSGDIHTFSVSSDGLTMVFSSGMRGGAGQKDLFICHRNNLDSPWSSPENMTSVNSPGPDWSPSLSADGQTLFFHSHGLSSADIYVSYFDSKTNEWSKPEAFDATISSASDEQYPLVSPNGLDFAVTRFPGQEVLTFNRQSKDAPFDAPFSIKSRFPELTIDAAKAFSTDSLNLLVESRQPLVLFRSSPNADWESFQVVSTLPKGARKICYAPKAGVLMYQQDDNSLWEMRLEKMQGSKTPADPGFAALLGKGDWQWSEPTVIDGLPDNAETMAISADGCTLVVAVVSSGLWVGRRKSTLEPWGDLQKIFQGWSPALSADGQTVYFHDNPSGDIWESHLNPQTNTWSERRLLGVEVNTPEREEYPQISPDGLELTVSRRLKQGRETTIHRRTSKDHPFSEGVLLTRSLPELPSTGYNVFAYSSDSLQCLYQLRAPDPSVMLFRDKTNADWTHYEPIKSLPQDSWTFAYAGEAKILLYQIGGSSTIWEMQLESKSEK